MRAELKAKWLEALRSGRFPQAAGRLKSDQGYCCLGVLCEVNEVPQDRSPIGTYEFTFQSRFGGEYAGYAMPPDNYEGLEDWHYTELVTMNDRGRPFKDIADWIEKNIPVD